MFINRYDLNNRDRNRIINYGHYQKQNQKTLNFNNNPSKLQKAEIKEKSPEDEIKLSKENKNSADNLTKVTLKRFKIEEDDKKLKNKNIKKEAKKTNTKLDYFI